MSKRTFADVFYKAFVSLRPPTDVDDDEQAYLAAYSLMDTAGYIAPELMSTLWLKGGDFLSKVPSSDRETARKIFVNEINSSSILKESADEFFKLLKSYKSKSECVEYLRRERKRLADIALKNEK